MRTSTFETPLGTVTVHYISNSSEVLAALNKLREEKVVGFDTETAPVGEWRSQIKSGVDPYKATIRLVQLATENKVAYVFDVFKINENAKTLIKEFLELESPIKCAHNGTFDIKFCRMHLGLKRFGRIFDTDVAARVIGMGRIPYNLKLSKLVLDHLGFELSKEERLTDWNAPELTREQVNYAALDAVVVLPLRKLLIEQIIDNKLVSACKVDFDVLDPVATMELNGLFLDTERWIVLDTQVRADRLDIIDEITLLLRDVLPQQALFPGAPLGQVKLTKKEPKKPKLSITSPKIIQEVMEDMGLVVPELKKRDGQIIKSTRSYLLEPLRSTEPLIDKLLVFRELQKRKTSYGADYPNKYIHPITGRIHAKYDPLRAVTSRFGNSSPNLQQIPAIQDYRDCFRPQCLDTHSFVIADYSQIELRIAAEFSQDYGYITAFASGEDFHAATAKLMFGEANAKKMRTVAKRINFGILYGMGPFKLSLQTGLTVPEATDHLRNYYNTFEGLMTYLHHAGKSCARYGRAYTWKGHIGRFFVDRQDKQSIAQAERNGMNLPIQGSSADILKIAMRLVHNEICGREDIKMVHIVHDEIILETLKEVAEEAKEILERCMIAAGSEFLKTVECKVDGNIANRWLK